MSVDKKRPLEDSEKQDNKLVKKAKNKVDVETLGDEVATLGVEEKKRKKKENREGKDGKGKKGKKSKKEKETKEDTTATCAETNDAEPDVEKPKKSKKSKKSKSRDGESNDITDEVARTEQETTEEYADLDNTKSAESNGAVSSYKQTSSLDAIPEAEVQSFLQSQNITISDPLVTSSSTSDLRPILQFSHLPTSTLVAKKPFAAFTAPTPIQSASWPFSLSGRDVIGIAETGSGKTIAFALPCIELLLSTPKPPTLKKDKTVYARAVIVSPTRELAMQTYAAISSLAGLVGLSAVCLYGGASKDDQRTMLRKHRGADIVVATPGRLKDFLSDGSVSLSQAKFAVLDEADRMLDKGFEEDVKLILGGCPARENRQTLMFTATWPASVRALAETFMVDPVKVVIGSKTRAGSDDDEDGAGDGTVELQANSRIEQVVEVVEPRGKEQRVLQLLREAQQGKARNDRVLVFCLYKKEAVRVEQFLQGRGIRVASIHGDLSQDRRTQSLEAFKAGTTTVLVATDVAARGLDIPEVKLVINVTFPLTIEDYVHRIGRTGRAGKHGKAITLFTEHDKAHSGSLVNVLRGANQPVPEDLLKFGTTVKKKTHDTYGAFFKNVDMNKKGTKITFD